MSIELGFTEEMAKISKDKDWYEKYKKPAAYGVAGGYKLFV